MRLASATRSVFPAGVFAALLRCCTSPIPAVLRRLCSSVVSFLRFAQTIRGRSSTAQLVLSGKFLTAGQVEHKLQRLELLSGRTPDTLMGELPQFGLSGLLRVAHRDTIPMNPQSTPGATLPFLPLVVNQMIVGLGFLIE